MSESPLINIARQWFDAFNEHNLEKLLSLYSEDAQHYSPKLKIRNPESNGLIKGKDSLRLWWKDSFERLPSLKYVPKKFIADNSGIFMEYERYVDGEESMTIGEVLEIKNGLIAASRVYHS
jgi:hypothetical protein